MKTKSIYPEYIISGFAHLVWLTMLVLIINDNDIYDFIKSLLTISPGAAALLAAFFFGVSLLLNSIVNRFLGDLSSLFSEPPELSKLYKAYKKDENVTHEMHMSLIGKRFFSSIALAGYIILIIAWYLNFKNNFSKGYLAILLIGIPIEIFTIVAFFTQRKDFKDRLNYLLRKNKPVPSSPAQTPIVHRK